MAVEFEHNGQRFQIQYLPGSRRIQVWSKPVERTYWTFGHGKEVPMGMSVQVAREVMRRYIVGDIDQDTYNATLPGK